MTRTALIVAALVCFALATFGVTGIVNLVAAGLALRVAADLV